MMSQLSEAGILPGDRVAIVLPNGIDFVVAFLGTVYARAVAAPLNSDLTQNEFQFYLEDAGSKVTIVGVGAPAAILQASKHHRMPVWQLNTAASSPSAILRPVGAAPNPPRPRISSEPQPDDIVLFLHTSGTTGRPKGVPLSNANLVASLTNIRESYKISTGHLFFSLNFFFFFKCLKNTSSQARSRAASHATVSRPRAYRCAAHVAWCRRVRRYSEPKVFSALVLASFPWYELQFLFLF